MMNELEKACRITGSDKTEPAALIEEITERVFQAEKYVNSLAAEVQQHGVRLFGHLAEGAAQGTSEDRQREPEGTVERLFIALSALDQSLARLGGFYTRISKV